MVPWIENFDGLWDNMKQELLGTYNKLKAVDVDNASNVELKYHNWDLKKMYMRMFEIHFLGMYASYNAWMLLEDICKERFGMNDHAPAFQDMMAGFPNKIYDMDKKLWEFGKLATDFGLADLFKENEPETIQATQTIGNYDRSASASRCRRPRCGVSSCPHCPVVSAPARAAAGESAIII